MKYYMITFDRKINASYKAFHDEFTKSPMIKQWFHYIKSSYIVGTNNTAEEISKHYTACAQNNNISTTHLVIEVNISNRQGMLVKDAWSWLKRHE